MVCNTIKDMLFLMETLVLVPVKVGLREAVTVEEQAPARVKYSGVKDLISRSCLSPEERIYKCFSVKNLEIFDLFT